MIDRWLALWRAALDAGRRRWRGRSLARAIDRDVSAYVDLLIEEYQARGLSAEDARRAALVEAGSVVAAREAVRDVRPLAWLRPIGQDLRYALRLIRRSPAISTAVIAAMALGIGATTTTFSAIDAVLIRPLPYADAGRLVVLLHHETNPVSPANFAAWKRGASGFDAMAAAEYWTPNLRAEAGQTPERIFALHVTGEMLPMLGVRPALGRLPAAGAHEVVIADGLWRRRFGTDPAIVGRTVELDATPETIVGVMPATFHFAPFWATRAELWGGFDPPADRGGESLRVFARLAPYITLTQARQEMAGITSALEAARPGTNLNVTVTPLKDKVVGDVRLMLVVLFGAVATVLLLACGNVAHLLLARATAREPEFAVRCAVGATRARVVRQLLTECLCLGMAGGGLGVLLSLAGVRVFTTLGARSVPRLETMAIDARVMAFAILLSILTAVLFGLGPAFRAARADVVRGLRAEDRSATPRSGRAFPRVLVGTQVALVLTVAAAAGLLVRTFAAYTSVNLGFAPGRVVSLVVSVAGTAEAAPGRRGLFYDELVRQLGAIPGVESAAAINHAPLVGDEWGTPYAVEGRPAPAPANVPTATYRVVSPSYFGTMGIRRVAGRGFTAADRADAAPVVIVNAQLASDAWPGQSPIGRRLRVALEGSPELWRTVVGIVVNTVREDVRDAPAAELFIPLEQSREYLTSDRSHFEAMTFVVRSSGDPGGLATPIRHLVHRLAPEAPVSDLITLQDAVDRAADAPRFGAVLVATFATVSLLLGAIGVFAVVTHQAASRTREIGIRRALGARPEALVVAIVRDSLAAAAIGLVAGLVGAAAVGRLIGSLLFGVASSDPATMASAAGLLAGVVAIACVWPAWRAVRGSVSRALR